MSWRVLHDRDMNSFEGNIYYAPTDLGQRQALFDLLYKQCLHEAPTPSQEGAKRRWKELRAWFVSTGEIYRIIIDRTCAGLLWTERQGQRLYLHDLVLFPDFRHRGIAGRVMRDLETSYADKSEEIEIGVKVSNRQARAVFTQLGFHISRAVEEMDYLILRKSIR